MEKVSIQPFTEAFIPLYHQWAEKEHVKNTWFLNGYEPVEYIQSKVEGNGYDYPFIIFDGDHPIGYIVYSDLHAYRTIHPQPTGPLKDESKGSVSIDLFIGDEDYLDKGYGTEALKQFSAMLLQKPEIKRLVIDPSCDNKRAIRCYEKVGFRFVKKAHDGVCLVQIMEMVNE